MELDFYDLINKELSIDGKISLLNSKLKTIGKEKWKATSFVNKKSGQGLAFFVTNVETDELGVLKIYNLSKKTNSRGRFQREINVLDKYNGTNGIIKLLDFDLNYGICITKKGIMLNEYWKNIKTINKGEDLFDCAVHILNKLCVGLINLHNDGIIHRDIKPDNIVVIDNNPYLIDFGVCYEDNSTRITLVDEAVGNAVYSSSVMQNFMEVVPPWLDVFQLNQVFLWMICAKNSKSWPRPLDWRFVLYPEEILGNHSLINRIRAFAASCSDFNWCPKDAAEMELLIKNILKMEKPSEEFSEINIEQIQKAIQQGQSSYILTRNELLSDFESTKEVFKQKYELILSSLEKESQKDAYNKLGLKIKYESDFDIFFNTVRKNTNGLAIKGPAVHFGFGENKQHFEILFEGKFFKKTYLETCPNFRKDFMPFMIVFVRQIPSDFSNTPLKDKFGIYMSRNGAMFLAQNNEVRPQEVYDFKEVNVSDILTQFIDFVNAPDYWSMIYSK